jgi:hypothetical protein
MRGHVAVRFVAEMRKPASLLSGTWTATVTAVAHAVDLEATARQFKALQRRRKIQTAEALLRLALIWAAGRQSLRQAKLRPGQRCA